MIDEKQLIRDAEYGHVEAQFKLGIAENKGHVMAIKFMRSFFGRFICMCHLSIGNAHHHGERNK